MAEKKITKTKLPEPVHKTDVPWIVVLMMAMFFDILKYILAALAVGLVIDSIVNGIAGFAFWMILKKGGSKTAFKDIRSSFGVGVVPVANLLFQSWTFRMWKLKKKYGEANALAQNKLAIEEKDTKKKLQVQKIAAIQNRPPSAAPKRMPEDISRIASRPRLALR